MKYIQASSDPWRAGDTAAEHPLLTLAQWQAARDSWPAGRPVGVAMANTDEVEALADDLPRFTLVTLDFPKWTDGRAYSQAHLLRARFRFAGELRATGAVLVDMLPLLQRTGFDAVQLREGQDEAAARRALTLVSEHYQGAIGEPRPLFNRVAA